jgi:hypothetical protein
MFEGIFIRSSLIVFSIKILEQKKMNKKILYLITLLSLGYASEKPNDQQTSFENSKSNVPGERINREELDSETLDPLVKIMDNFVLEERDPPPLPTQQGKEPLNSFEGWKNHNELDDREIAKLLLDISKELNNAGELFVDISKKLNKLEESFGIINPPEPKKELNNVEEFFGIINPPESKKGVGELLLDISKGLNKIEELIS